jgi:PAS domain S-box-containing protein
MIHRCGKVKLRSYVMLLWTCLTCILLAIIYFVFTMLIYHHYQEQTRERIEPGILTLEHRLKEGLKQDLDFARQSVTVLGETLILVFVVVFLLFFPVAAFFIRYSVISPVERLIVAMNSFDTKHYPHLDENVGTVEFSSLASAFNRMVRVLRHHDQQVNILSTAVEQNPSAVVITDIEGRIEYVNSRMEQLTGYTAEELKGRSTSIFQSGYTSEEKYDELWQTVTGGKVWKEELLNKRKDGTLSWESVVVAPIFAENATVIKFVATKEDITERKHTRELLRQSERRYRQTFETNMAVKLIVDPTDGSIVEANQAAASYYGYSVELLVAMLITDINQLSPKEVREEMAKAEQEERLSFNFRHKLASGKVRDVEVYSGPLQSGERTLLYSIVHDVTDRKQAEEKLLKTNERLELVVKGANLGTWDWNISTGKVVFNDRWAEFLGYTLAELSPNISTWEERLHPDGKQDVMQTLEDHLSGQTSLFMAEQRLRNKAGDWVWTLGAGRVFDRDAQGTPTRAVGILLDINAQKQAEQQLIAAKEQAESANRAKSVFLANITHELRTPLNAVLGYAQLLGADSTLTSKQLNSAQIIRNSGEYLLMLINDILDLSKIEAEKIELVSRVFRLSDLFSEVVDIFRAEADFKGVTLRCQEDPQQPTFVQADELRMRQVILNLLSNAVKFTPDGGYCLLQSDVKKHGEKKACLTITVEDSGPGILQAMQEEIFEPFRQSGERLQYSEGTGLGLAISRKLVRLMGGELQVKSPLGPHYQQGEGLKEPGSRFFFTIPVEIIEQERPTQENKHVVTGYSIIKGDTPKKILIISGSASNQAVLENILSPLGFQVDALVNKDILADILADMLEQSRPDAILTVLPTAECEELAVLQQIKEQEEWKFLPVIALADEAVFSALEEKQQENFCTAHVVKPFSSFDLLSVLAEHLPIVLVYDNDSDNEGGNGGKTVENKQELVLPPDEELKVLLLKVQQGDVAGINRQIASLLSMDSGKYKEFAGQVERLAEDFQLNVIADLVKRYGISQ